MNDIINNFKKPMDRRELPEWHYKEKAILQIADWMVSTTCWDKIKGATWVPIPPSKIKTDPLYDDRLWRVLQKMQEIENTLDARKLLMARYSRESAHNRDALRPKVQDHIRNFTLDESQRNPTPKAIILFDDVITSGANFKAAQIIIQKEFPDVPIIGLFIARNVWVENIA